MLVCRVTNAGKHLGLKIKKERELPLQLTLFLCRGVLSRVMLAVIYGSVSIHSKLNHYSADRLTVTEHLGL